MRLTRIVLFGLVPACVMSLMLSPGAAAHGAAHHHSFVLAHAAAGCWPAIVLLVLALAMRFDSDEHLHLGSGEVQSMVDWWAHRGLIEGGAFVDSHDTSPNDWNYVVPTEKGEYPDWLIGNGGNYYWHYIFPDPLKDSSGQRWTNASLKAAVIKGEAAVLTIGHILMLGGDFFPELDQMHEHTPREAVHVMKGFKKPDPFAYLMLDGLIRCTSWVVYDVRGGYFDTRNDAKDFSSEQQILWTQDAQREGLKTLVEYILACRGLHRTREIHLLSRLVGAHIPLTPDSIKACCPWAPIPAFVTAEAREKIKGGMDAEFFHTVASNGQYLVLARENYAHFSENDENWTKFCTYHRGALDLIKSRASKSDKPPIPALAIAKTAFGLHFMTDAFSSGHLRVPRKKLGPTGGLAAKVMHDTDNMVGLLVKDGFGDVWRAFGDDCLQFVVSDMITDADDRKKAEEELELRWKLLKGSRPGMGLATESKVNELKAKTAVAAAFKQLRVHAEGNANPSMRSWPDVDTVGCPIGKAGPEHVDLLKQDVDARLQWMDRHRPHDLPVSKDPTKGNHPPLYLPGQDTPNLSANAYRADAHELWLDWYVPPLKKPAERFHQSFSLFYYLSSLSQDRKGWMEPNETCVITLFDKLQEQRRQEIEKMQREHPYLVPVYPAF